VAEPLAPFKPQWCEGGLDTVADGAAGLASADRNAGKIDVREIGDASDQVCAETGEVPDEIKADGTIGIRMRGVRIESDFARLNRHRVPSVEVRRALVTEIRWS
jgi:hypothetical protein